MRLKNTLTTLLWMGSSLAFGLPSEPPLPYCPPKVVDASTLTGKFMFGYQGWFGYPGDGSANNAWFHWRREKDGQTKYMTDMLPDVSEYDADELAPSGMTCRDGSPLMIYSAYHAKTVERHFEWMREYGLDGVFVQRFSNELAHSEVIRQFRDHVLKDVQASAEKNGRVFSLMWDISGDKDALAHLEKDWVHLVDDLKLTRSPRFLHHKGRPVIAVWGLGFGGNLDAAQAAELIHFFKDNPRPELRVTLVGGVPTHWRSLTRDSLADPAWNAVYRSLDVISPWTVGRYADMRGNDNFRRQVLEPDMAAAKAAGVEYLPVVFPGYSARNLSFDSKPLNEIRREGGTFFWHQFFNATDAGAIMLYGAMFDEVDEGTAFYKVIPDSGQLPTQGGFVALDADGYVLPSDWYLKVAGIASMGLQGLFKPTALMPLDLSHSGQYDGSLYCAPAHIPQGQGKVLSIDFVGGGSMGTPGLMAPVERAGLKPASYWNSAESESGSLDSLMNDAGDKTSVSLSWQSGGVWCTPLIEKMGDARMMKGYLDTTEGTSITVEVKGLPESFAKKGYKVVVYMDGDDSQATRKAMASIGTQSVEFVDPPAEFFSGHYIQSKDGKPGNYVVFDGLKEDHFKLQVTPGASTGPNRRSPVNGLQIISR